MFQRIARIVFTLMIAGVAGYAGYTLWTRYIDSPWTRDGRVRADIIAVSPDVAGVVTQVPVIDDAEVHKGDVLFVVDTARYEVALEEAEASLQAARIEASLRQNEAERRASLGAVVVSSESQQVAKSAASSAGAKVRQALSAVAAAQLNLARTRVISPVDGYVANLNVHAGDYAIVGRPLIAIVDRHSFRVEAYFEETKLPGIQTGAPADMRLLGSNVRLSGHVEGLARAISEPDVAGLLSNVSPTFHWVRLAARIPVRIAIDKMPDGVTLASGMTCTVIIR